MREAAIHRARVEAGRKGGRPRKAEKQTQTPRKAKHKQVAEDEHEEEHEEEHNHASHVVDTSPAPGLVKCMAHHPDYEAVLKKWTEMKHTPRTPGGFKVHICEALHAGATIEHCEAAFAEASVDEAAWDLQARILDKHNPNRSRPNDRTTSGRRDTGRRYAQADKQAGKFKGR